MNSPDLRYPPDGGIGRFAELPQYLTEVVDEATREQGEAITAACSGLVQPSLMMIPHIDYRRGRQTYGVAGVCLRKMEPPDVLYLLGVDHHGGRNTMFHLSRRTYATSLGEAAVCQATCDQIEETMGAVVFSNQWLHDCEWTIENPLVLLQSCFRPMPLIVPIIVSSDDNMFDSVSISGSLTRNFISVLRDSVLAHQAAGRRVLIVAGVDLSHCGTYFSGGSPVTPAEQESIAATDGAYLQHLATLKPAEAELAIGRNATCIDAVAAMGVSIRAALGAKLLSTGAILRYQQSFDRARDCLVSHAAATWFY